MKLIGIALLIIGIGLGYWGYETSGSLTSQINETMNGAPSDKVMMLYIGGAVSFVVGLLLSLKK